MVSADAPEATVAIKLSLIDEMRSRQEGSTAYEIQVTIKREAQIVAQPEDDEVDRHNADGFIFDGFREKENKQKNRE